MARTNRPEGRRAVALMWAAGAGVAVALGARWLGADDRAWLALPLAVALGWWRVGTPDQCLAPPATGAAADASRSDQP